MALAVAVAKPVAVGVEKSVAAKVTQEAEKGGLNLYKWKDETSMLGQGWREEDHFLYILWQGTAKDTWKLNAGRLREAMAKGKPIFDSYVDEVGERIPTKGFLNAERELLKEKGWMFSPVHRAWLPPTN